MIFGSSQILSSLQGIGRKLSRKSNSKLLVNAAAVPLLLLLAIAWTPSQAQSTRRPRRESSANRKARIARTVTNTYGHRFEVAGGGGFERYRSGQYLQQNNEVTFWASTLYSLNPRLGVLGEVRGAYGRAKIGNLLPSGNVLSFNPQISEYNFLVGPSYRLVGRERLSLSAFVEGGVTLGKFAGDSKGLTAAQIGVWQGNYAAAFAAGLNLDYNLFPNVALRVTPTYLGSTFGGTLQNSKGLNVGVVYRFGRTR